MDVIASFSYYQVYYRVRAHTKSLVLMGTFILGGPSITRPGIF